MCFRTILFIFILLCSSTAFGDQSPSLMLENRNLQAELQTAQKPNIYFIFNLKERYVHMKAKGIVLREIPIRDVSYWGNRLSGNAYRLLRKSTLLKPWRDRISPGETQDDDFEIDALEVDDMPSGYVLKLDKGLHIRVHSNGLSSRIGDALSSMRNVFFRPLVTVWHAAWQEPYIVIDIRLNESDAQALYWSFFEGMYAVVYPL